MPFFSNCNRWVRILLFSCKIGYKDICFHFILLSKLTKTCAYSCRLQKSTRSTIWEWNLVIDHRRLASPLQVSQGTELVCLLSAEKAGKSCCLWSVMLLLFMLCKQWWSCNVLKRDDWSHFAQIACNDPCNKQILVILLISDLFAMVFFANIFKLMQPILYFGVLAWLELWQNYDSKLHI
jgi:hypothetical protein